MCDSYTRSLLRVSVAQICQALGWDAVQLTACDLLSDVLHRYIQQLARGCHRYSELYGRTDPVLDDVGQVFRLLGVNLSELSDYVQHLEPLGFAHQMHQFPVSKNNMLQFPQAGALDMEERKEYIPDYMPPLVSLQEEEEEEQNLADLGTSAEAMQVPLDEEQEEMEEDEAVNDENYLGKRHLDSSDSMELMPATKRPRLPGVNLSDSPDWGTEPREPLSSLNSQQLPQGTLPTHHSLNFSSPLNLYHESQVPPLSSRPQATNTRPSDAKPISIPSRKPKINSPRRQKMKSPKRASLGSGSSSPIRSPKAAQKEKKKSPGRTKGPKSPKSPKLVLSKVSHPPGKAEAQLRPPLAVLSDKMGIENIQMQTSLAAMSEPEKLHPEIQQGSLEPPNNTIDDSITAVIARACAKKEPDPFAFASGSESDLSSSPRRLTISEPMTPRLELSANSFGRVTSTPIPSNAGAALGAMNSWTMDDSINEVIRKANQGGSSGPSANPTYMSSASASPPTPEPLLKVYEEKAKQTVSTDIKKKLKKELRTKMKKRDKEKLKEKERDKGKNKEKSKDKNKDKEREFFKEPRLPWNDIGSPEHEQGELFRPQDLSEIMILKVKSKDGSKRDKDRHKDKKKDKEKSKRDKEKRDKGKEKNKEERQKASASQLGPKEALPALFSTSILPPLAPILLEKDKAKEKERKKEKKEKKKKKDKEKEKGKVKEREREKEEKKKEKEKKEKERDKETPKEKHKEEKVKAEPPAAPVLSPVIPRLTLRVRAGQDKIVISKVVPTAEVKTPVVKTPVVKTPVPKTPAAKSGPNSRPRTPPPAPILSPVPPLPPVILHLPPTAPPSASPAPVLPLPPSSLPSASSSKMPVRSVITETVSTYVIRDESGNQIWICPGCNKPDDGSPMIGCDDCDDWYHWPCVGVLAAPPEDVQWFCTKCDSKKKDKKHKKRKHKVR
ncbi:transcription initiation factor TFIID subunit 3-like [Brienomyrus brachyistius]|uniref:transcription initiation factor TFIID subunit 3-like n=1 Tax=Brienomyrus brachyistius TaxID=42636 RepID=UPI0020B3EC30|nr:transcription initiation factor TFIID subunit 3-like [Brienomyrus brachyistius]